jgi:hypothetical protein
MYHLQPGLFAEEEADGVRANRYYEREGREREDLAQDVGLPERYLLWCKMSIRLHILPAEVGEAEAPLGEIPAA